VTHAQTWASYSALYQFGRLFPNRNSKVNPNRTNPAFQMIRANTTQLCESSVELRE